MWQGQIFVGMVGLCGGAVVATALAAFIIELNYSKVCRNYPYSKAYSFI